MRRKNPKNKWIYEEKFLNGFKLAEKFQISRKKKF